MNTRMFLSMAVFLLFLASGSGVRPGVCAGHSDGAERPHPESSREACRTIAAILAVYPVLEVKTTEGPVRDPLDGSERAGCLVFASGPASGLAGEVPPEEPIRFLMGESGWEEDPRYAADGPGTTSFALRKGSGLCLFGGGAPSGIEGDTFLGAERFVFEAGCTGNPGNGDPGAGR